MVREVPVPHPCDTHQWRLPHEAQDQRTTAPENIGQLLKRIDAGTRAEHSNLTIIDQTSRFHPSKSMKFCSIHVIIKGFNDLTWQLFPAHPSS